MVAIPPFFMRTSKYDWDKYRIGFILENRTLVSMSRETTGNESDPSLQVLEQMSHKCGWSQQKKLYEQGIISTGAALESAKIETVKIADLSISASEELATRLQIARDLRKKAQDALKVIKPETIKAKEILEMLQQSEKSITELLSINQSGKKVALKAKLEDMSIEDLELFAQGKMEVSKLFGDAQ